MANKTKLSKKMTVEQFDNGYWYALELKNFAKEICIPSYSKLRKDEIEKAIKYFLRNGKVKSPTKRNLTKSGKKDIELGLKLSLPVINYSDIKETKSFIDTKAKKLDPNFKQKSGARYRLNRWREEQLTKGKRITYGDLVKQYVKLNQHKGKFKQAPSGRYINFLSDFLANEKNSTREKAMKEWAKLKKMDIPKNYKSWVKANR